MDLHSGLPYWPLLHGIIASYPSLSEDIKCDVAIIGGGITGALAAWHLSEAGYDVALFDRRHIGMGSTAVTTALLQYELDTPLYKLIRKKGKADAERSYLLCEGAIHKMGVLCDKVGASSAYCGNSSFQFASFRKDRQALLQEFECRKKAGIKVDWMDAAEVRKKYGINKSGGIYSASGAGLDAYELTHKLLQDACKKNVRVFDHTDITRIEYLKRSLCLYTGENKKIKARKLVIACGYESEQFLPFKVQRLHSTFAIVSEPMPAGEFWFENSLIWETANPYLYMRVTSDYRVLVGGKDITGSDPGKRYRLLPAKAKQLENAIVKLFPSLPFKKDFSWAGSFASTRDGLPYIGEVRQRPHTFFILGMGGNGIPFSMVATDLLIDWLEKKANHDMHLFSFER